MINETLGSGSLLNNERGAIERTNQPNQVQEQARGAEEERDNPFSVADRTTFSAEALALAGQVNAVEVVQPTEQIPDAATQEGGDTEPKENSGSILDIRI